MFDRSINTSTIKWFNRNLVQLIIATVVCASSAIAQSDATKPERPPVESAKPGAGQPTPAKPNITDLVINPTTAECERGWLTGMKWSKEEFDQLCAVMKSAK